MFIFFIFIFVQWQMSIFLISDAGVGKPHAAAAAAVLHSGRKTAPGPDCLVHLEHLDQSGSSQRGNGL